MAAKFIGAEDLESNEEPRVVVDVEVARSGPDDDAIFGLLGSIFCNFGKTFWVRRFQFWQFFFKQKNTIDVFFFARTKVFFFG